MRVWGVLSKMVNVHGGKRLLPQSTAIAAQSKRQLFCGGHGLKQFNSSEERERVKTEDGELQANVDEGEVQHVLFLILFLVHHL